MQRVYSVPLSKRRGAVLVVTMICLLLVSTLMGALLKMALSQRRQMRQEEFRIQADWLADSGAQRAVYSLAEEETYTGEEWKIPADQLDGYHSATVAITVKTPDEADAPKQITVDVTYPADSRTSVRCRKTLTY